MHMHSSGRSLADGHQGERTAPAHCVGTGGRYSGFRVFEDALVVDAAHHDMIDSRA